VKKNRAPWVRMKPPGRKTVVPTCVIYEVIA
jgi:hypothetical protein